MTKGGLKGSKTGTIPSVLILLLACGPRCEPSASCSGLLVAMRDPAHDGSYSWGTMNLSKPSFSKLQEKTNGYSCSLEIILLI